ncbi:MULTISPECIES: type II toxin-antitoxin system VapC family toxin [unclassified Bradyrhizobium]|uniref:type II toxin-antitoxin system VapC family toxin n=1 Tax=unclassified Bradyrhizobium TaxID=2631580 RepID=UPI00211EF2DB|nr:MULTISPECIES: type II toxin-antitoxin system VapC family toxin [unclassified Bradyrhizobium]MDD1534618.1 VapC toxin family PIN domain ribonuclease [Bradyrhizobium sp. WBOS8]MDD1581482.1 VapC toxin family PIN domain ribonuclease [Bradyrhizobium sp. WBOS4]UUO49767.1 VapC toxin family PIN domain ribonuclease [Bradyrhizobium sp. WBOS04]UUO58533.1 VapC toxin family PIN domain ribonuclease [Bradyrhizobium sp. WBOS08]
MIAVDTSALMAIVLDEPQANGCIAALETADELLISAATAAESLIVAARRGVHEEMQNLIANLGFNVISVTRASAERVAQIYSRWGRGIHPAGLNFGDCFAYDVAKENGCALLYVGDDFAQTDITAAV